MRVRTFVSGAATGVLLAGAMILAPASIAQERTGRFTMQPVDGGYLRLDTATGDMSICTRTADAFECKPAKDDRDLQSEIARISDENKKLKAEVKRLEEMVEGGLDQPLPAPKFELPKEEDVDKALSYLERMFRKFRDKMKELDKPADAPDQKGTPL